MTSVSTADPQFRSAVEACVSALRRVADYELEPTLQQRLQDLGERKEFLGPDEHAELMALVDFTRKRTIESLESKLALQRLRDVLPGASDRP